MTVAAQVGSALRTRYARAIALDTPDAGLWKSLGALADLHHQSGDMQAGQPRCQECGRGSLNRVWPCQTLRLLATGLGIEVLSSRS